MTYLEDDASLIKSMLPRDVSPPAESDYLFILYAVLMRSQGEAVRLSDVHDAWTAWKLLTTDDHEALLPFDQLDPDVQAEDQPYVDAIVAAARRQKERPSF
ncbi:DUF7701 domain-containing protein [Mycobacterium deserti]|uniref:DUF7701 domain-containing protein n=1 Tax=Mycobacterium deserti TaxID=2978347 RepID=A0ABT2M6S5_9MYCO|nr:hypothetical protein [Mycobacterium deserti]MCT7657641.1 hypothetical protein [Mycobacterium deserti]